MQSRESQAELEDLAVVDRPEGTPADTRMADVQMLQGLIAEALMEDGTKYGFQVLQGHDLRLVGMVGSMVPNGTLTIRIAINGGAQGAWPGAAPSEDDGLREE